MAANNPHAPERIWLPADTDSDTWNVLAKNPSRDWSTGEPANNIPYARVHQTDDARVEGARQRLQAFINGDKYALVAQHVSNTEKDRDITGDVEAVLSLLPQPSTSAPGGDLTVAELEARDSTYRDSIIAPNTIPTSEPLSRLKDGGAERSIWHRSDEEMPAGKEIIAIHDGWATFSIGYKHEMEIISNLDVWTTGKELLMNARGQIASAESGERRCGECGHTSNQYSLGEDMCYGWVKDPSGKTIGGICGHKCVFPATKPAIEYEGDD